MEPCQEPVLCEGSAVNPEVPWTLPSSLLASIVLKAELKSLKSCLEQHLETLLPHALGSR